MVDVPSLGWCLSAVPCLCGVSTVQADVCCFTPPPPLFVATFQVAVYPTKSPYDPRDLCRGKVTRTLSQLCRASGF